jgi:ribosome-binding protein aMBF1 (putative translation factor)
MVQGENEENCDKSCRVESPNGGSRREMSQCKRSLHDGSHHERHHREKTHCKRRHRDKSQHDESRHSQHDEEMEDLKKKYAHILRRIDGEDPKTTA